MNEQYWSVTVNVGGEDVLSIGHNWLSGVNNVDEYRDTIRNCALHLLAFIGCNESGEIAQPERIDFAAELKAEQDADRWNGNFCPQTWED